jgi:hypothetical protein
MKRELSLAIDAHDALGKRITASKKALRPASAKLPRRV